jgi:N-hydroxyarylamine O-acetyltransferase
MQAKNFNLADYLARIDFAGEAKADLATLNAMMRAQLFSVPFENLDVQAGKIISLVPEDIVEKIVYQRRGGYCYEVNGLFAMALTALGIEYELIGARPMFYPTRRPKTHMVLLVKLDGKQWICDLGFGSFGIRAPMGMHQLNQPQQQDYDRFQLVQLNEREYAVQAWIDAAWVNQFSFDLDQQEWIDFMPVNYMNSTHPDTIFVQKLLVILHNPQGRSILLGDKFKAISQGEAQERQLAAAEIPLLLAEVFHLPPLAQLVKTTQSA